MRSGTRFTNEPANDACLVRPARPDDHLLLQQVLDEATGTKHALIHGDDGMALLLAHRVYLGFLDERPIGCVMASVGENKAVIHNLAVAQPFRNRGHATTLVKVVMAHLSESGALTYWTAADPANPSAVRRFHLLGFVPFDDGVARDKILMVRDPHEPPVAKKTGRRQSTSQMSAFNQSNLRTAAAGLTSASND